jgi:1-acyl-sn-glycerol-3-phosphate acyltransferase
VQVVDTNYRLIDYDRFSTSQSLYRWVSRGIFAVIAKMDVMGTENTPRRGRCIVAINHLHLLDTPIGVTFLPRRVVVFVKSKYKRVPIVGFFLRSVCDAIFAGPSDQSAYSSAVDVLSSGGVLGTSPEGTRSKTGQLAKGHTGIARLAFETQSPTLPMAIYGQEQCTAYWRTLRRVPVFVRIGVPIGPSHITDPPLDYSGCQNLDTKRAGIKVE